MISLIIPAYNCSDKIIRAVGSAVEFSIVTEIIIVEDGSKDDTLIFCKKCDDLYSKVVLITHDNGENRGAGASRNLGISIAKNEWIAFLDADDVFLKSRFDAESSMLGKPHVDGVYGSITSFDATKKNYAEIQIQTGLSGYVSPDNLKFVLFGLRRKPKGYFSIIAMTVRKSLIFKIGLFNEKMRLHQDTDLIMKLSLVGDLVPGGLDKPVASRGVHPNNRFLNNKDPNKSRALQYSEMYLWLNQHPEICDNNSIIYKHFRIQNNLFNNENINTFKILSKYCLKNKEVFSRPVYAFGLRASLLRIYSKKKYRAKMLYIFWRLSAQVLSYLKNLGVKENV